MTGIRVKSEPYNRIIRRDLQYHIPTMPNRTVKISSTKRLAKLVRGAAHPRMRAAAAGLGQVLSLTKAGDVLLK